MRPTSKDIGNKSVMEARHFYESGGYITSEIEHTGRFKKYKDAFSEYFEKNMNRSAGFDVLCIHETKKPILVQVTTSKPKIHIPYIAFAKRFANHVGVEVFIGTENGNKRIIYKPDGSLIKINVRR